MADPADDPDFKVDPDHVRAAFAAYFSAMSEGRVDDILALFAEDAVAEDPVGTPPRRGLAEIRAMYEKAMAGAGGRIDIRGEGAVRIARTSGASMAVAVLQREAGALWIDTLDIMHFDTAGKVRLLQTVFGPENMRLVR